MLKIKLISGFLCLITLISQSGYAQLFSKKEKGNDLGITGQFMSLSPSTEEYSGFDTLFAKLMIDELSAKGIFNGVFQLPAFSSSILVKTILKQVDPPLIFNIPHRRGIESLPASVKEVLMFENGKISFSNADSANVRILINFNYVRLETEGSKIISGGNLVLTRKGMKNGIPELLKELAKLSCSKLYGGANQVIAVATDSFDDWDDSHMRIGVFGGWGGNLQLEYTKNNSYGSSSYQETQADPSVGSFFENNSSFFGGTELKFNSHFAIAYSFSKEKLEGKHSFFTFYDEYGYSRPAENETLEITTHSLLATFRQSINEKGSLHILCRGGLNFKSFEGTGDLLGNSFTFKADDQTEIELGGGFEFRPSTVYWGFQLYSFIGLGSVNINQAEAPWIKPEAKNQKLDAPRLGIRVSLFYDFPFSEM